MPASALRDVCAVELTVDDARRRIDIRITGPATGPVVAAPVAELFLQRPELCTYDMFYDLSAYNGDVTATDLDPIVDAYARCHPDTRVPTRTAFLTPDRYFQSWASAMDTQFPGREHRAFPRGEKAAAFLDTPLDERRRGAA